jgi:hypothetical protein
VTNVAVISGSGTITVMEENDCENGTDNNCGWHDNNGNNTIAVNSGNWSMGPWTSNKDFSWLELGLSGGLHPSAVAHTNGEQDIFWKGTDGNLWEKWWNHGRQGPINLGMGPLGSSPTAVVQASTQLHVRALGGDG